MDAMNPTSCLRASMAGTITSVSQPQADIAYASAVSTLGRELRRGHTLGLEGAKISVPSGRHRELERH